MDILKFIKKLNIKTWLIIFLMGYIILLQECNNNENNEKTTKIDTVYSTQIDSIYIVDTITITSHIISRDTVYVDNDTISVFKNRVEDEMLSGEITSYIDGTLIDQEFKYVAKFPQYIHTIDTVRITNTPKPVYRLYIGGEVGGAINTFNISPVIGYSSRKGNNYTYRYGLIDKTHNIGISRTILQR